MSKNQLNGQASAYLRQHKDNPVHWYPYGSEALKIAQELDRPLFVSVGYSTCHWCHVMAYESFENPEVADILNNNFICIKVDREEFPHVDDYYQVACQFFSQSGGWPLSAFALPDQRPFFVGTYFPAVSRPKLSSFKEVILELARVYKEEKEQVLKNAKEVDIAIKKGRIEIGNADYKGQFPHPVAVLKAVEKMADKKYGGHGEKPKFPHFSFLIWQSEQLLENILEKDQAEHLLMTVDQMLFGGIYDQVRGGIHRYSTDQKWLVPHFEKMLYDQAGLISLLSKISVVYHAPHVLDGIYNTLEYLEIEMKNDEGHFFAAQDADAEGVEGLYHTFTLEEFKNSLTKNEEDVLADNIDDLISWFGISEAGNFDHQLNVLSLDINKKSELLTQAKWDLIRKAKLQLLTDRAERISPLTDNKGVAAWNFMMITALIDVIQYCKAEGIKKKANDILNKTLKGTFSTFLISNLSEKNKQVIRHVSTQASTPQYLEDYVFFAECNFRLFEISGNRSFLKNTFDTIDHIEKTFYLEDVLYSVHSVDMGHIKEIGLPSHFGDTSYKCPASTLVCILKRIHLIQPELNYLQKFEKLQQNLREFTLQYPLSAGEGLRALTYPDEVYRLLKLPGKWMENSKFLAFLCHIPSRFTICFHETSSDMNSDMNKDEKWEMCRNGACESSGQGLDQFIKTLSPSS